jgi:hypothetical protein
MDQPQSSTKTVYYTYPHNMYTECSPNKMSHVFSFDGICQKIDNTNKNITKVLIQRIRGNG